MVVKDENTSRKHIKEVRAKHNWSRYELSRQTNVGESTIRTWETGKNPISPRYIQFLAALGYEIRIERKGRGRQRNRKSHQ